jgi:rfaE bifunctional protein nucleotidyltransferase chain/domain
MMGTVVDLRTLKGIRDDLRRKQKMVVFTNGCFDIIHRGHIEYLSSARAMGDVLIVGVNTDSSVRRIKGENRPIIPEGDRAYIVAGLAPVDYAVLFGEDTPRELIQTLLPDVLVKGADWSIEEVVGREIVEGSGGTVRTIQFVSGRSTSAIINEILRRFT